MKTKLNIIPDNPKQKSIDQGILLSDFVSSYPKFFVDKILYSLSKDYSKEKLTFFFILPSKSLKNRKQTEEAKHKASMTIE